jgi:hypothetical protein
MPFIMVIPLFIAVKICLILLGDKGKAKDSVQRILLFNGFYTGYAKK